MRRAYYSPLLIEFRWPANEFLIYEHTPGVWLSTPCFTFHRSLTGSFSSASKPSVPKIEKESKTPRRGRRISRRFHLRGAPRRLGTFERGCSARAPCQTVPNILKTSQSRREWTTGGRASLSLSLSLGYLSSVLRGVAGEDFPFHRGQRVAWPNRSRSPVFSDGWS